jgi:DNA polymerase I-like protein with 3'-5' exonuclease and polymerase domains
MCKKIGHGTNYGGKPWTLSRQAKLDIGPIEEFQPKYFTAFPAHLRWHEWVRNQLQTRGTLTTLTGRRRWFFGRRDSDDTYREALAYDPQGSLADILNRGMLAVWRADIAELLMQIHDAILVQYPEEEEDETIPRIQARLRQELELKHGRTLVMLPDVKTGWNWGNYGAKNPDGLKSYVPGDQRKRSPKTSILDRVIP